MLSLSWRGQRMRSPGPLGITLLDAPFWFGCKLLDSDLLGLYNTESKRKTDREVGQWEEKLDHLTPSSL